jgi:hypothetical protein
MPANLAWVAKKWQSMPDNSRGIRSFHAIGTNCPADRTRRRMRKKLHEQIRAGGARQLASRRAIYFDFLRLADPRRPASADWRTLAGSDEVSEECCAGSEVAGVGSGWSGTPTISSEGTRVDAGWSGTAPPMSWRLAQASHFSQFSCSSAMACSKDGAMPANRIMAGSAHTPLMAQSHCESNLSGVSLL